MMIRWRKKRRAWEGIGRWAMGALLCLVLLGCGEDPAQILETAQFEEQQNNLLHAQELYEQIIREFPESTQAQTAKERMAELRKMPPGGE